MKRTNEPLLEGRVFPALTRFSIPILFSLILQALYGAVDLWMVSRFATTADVSAVSTGSQTMMIVGGMITGLSMGITVLLGLSIGKRDDEGSAGIIGTSTWIFLVLALALTGGLMLAARPLAVLLNAPAAALDKTTQYILICGAGTIFVVGFNVLNGIFCGVGDSKTPLLFVTVACITNMVGDYLLIDLFHLGAVGAAMATIAAQAVSVIFCLCMVRKKLPFPVGRRHFRFQSRLALSVLKLGLPVAVLRMCTEISYLVILGFVNVHGEVASSGVGIAEKLVMFILLIPTAYMSSISTFVAQNLGADRPERAKRGLWTGMASAGIVGGVMAYVSFFHGEALSLLFIKDRAVITASAEFLKATAIECFVLSLAYCFDGYFNGMGKTTLVMVRGVAAALLVRIPYAYFVSSLPDASLFQIGLATALAAAFMLVFCMVEYAVRAGKGCRLVHHRSITGEN